MKINSWFLTQVAFTALVLGGFSSTWAVADDSSIPEAPSIAQSKVSTEAARAATPLAAPSFSMAGSALRMVGGLLFCFGVLGAGLQIYKRYGSSVAIGNKKRIRVIERMQLSQKSALVLVSLDGREMLLTVGSETARMVQAQLPLSREAFDESYSELVASANEERRCVS